LPVYFKEVKCNANITPNRQHSQKQQEIVVNSLLMAFRGFPVSHTGFQRLIGFTSKNSE